MTERSNGANDKEETIKQFISKIKLFVYPPVRLNFSEAK